MSKKFLLSLIVFLLGSYLFLGASLPVHAAQDCQMTVEGSGSSTQLKFQLLNPANYQNSLVNQIIYLDVFAQSPSQPQHPLLETQIDATNCTGAGIGNGQGCFVEVSPDVLRNSFQSIFQTPSYSNFSFIFSIGPGTAPVCATNVQLATILADTSAAVPIGQPTNELDSQTFDALNPLKQFGDPTTAQQFSTPGGVITRVLEFAFPVAGLILFVMIVWGGFEILSGAMDKKSLDAGKQRVTAALIGFLLLFASYWIMQIVQVIFGVKVL